MTAYKSGDPTTINRLYGRSKGKPLRAAQQDLVEQLLPQIAVPAEGEVTAERLFGQPCTLHFEIGFGGGEHMVHMAARNPQIHLIGAEPFVNGIAMLLGKIRAAGVTNLSLHPRDVREVFDVLPDACLSKVFLNYPDPWPKARHHRRRFVTPDYLLPLARCMAPGAELRVATDIPDYVRQTLEEVPPTGFELVRQGGPGEAWEDWLSTRYEQKALREGREPHYLTFRRL